MGGLQPHGSTYPRVSLVCKISSDSAVFSAIGTSVGTAVGNGVAAGRLNGTSVRPIGTSGLAGTNGVTSIEVRGFDCASVTGNVDSDMFQSDPHPIRTIAGRLMQMTVSALVPIVEIVLLVIVISVIGVIIIIIFFFLSVIVPFIDLVTVIIDVMLRGPSTLSPEHPE